MRCEVICIAFEAGTAQDVKQCAAVEREGRRAESELSPSSSRRDSDLVLGLQRGSTL